MHVTLISIILNFYYFIDAPPVLTESLVSIGAVTLFNYVGEEKLAWHLQATPGQVSNNNKNYIKVFIQTLFEDDSSLRYPLEHNTVHQI